MKRTAVLTSLLAMTLTSGVMAQDQLTSAVNQYVATSSTLNPAHGIPRATQRNGTWAFSTVNYWTSGFYAGTLWYLSTTNKNPELQSLAERWTLPLANIPFGSFSHDLGFEFNPSFVNAYRFTADERFRGPALNAARLLALRFNPIVGAIKSWDWMPPERPYPVIADNMMNLELLFWGARQSNGDKNWYNVAVQHARTTLREHVRPDGGSYHVIVFDPHSGKVIERITHQGFAHNSTWARGEAWLVYGFTMTFRETGEREFLDAARKVADYFIDHLPADGIPCWDFNAPGCQADTVQRDASAAAIVASGLLELSTYVDRQTSNKYRSTADRILSVLSSSQYRSRDGAALLKHSVGNMPGNSEVDVGIVYADYYYVEALLRQKQMNGDTSVHVFPARMPITYTARPDLLRKSKERLHRGDVEAKLAVAKLIAAADSALRAGPFTVTAKTRMPPSGDKRDYVSYGPYWWPDSTKPNGLPYIQRDGQVNPETRRDSDVLRWYAFTDALETLTLAYYFTDDTRYSDRAAVLLRTWFIDPQTRMNPNQNYGQAIPGVVEGRGIGLIDFRDYGKVLDEVSLLEASPSWSPADDKQFRDWITQYTNWLKTSKNGIDEAAAKNNHGTWYDVQLGALELFTGDTAAARTLFEQSREKRIAAQIDSLGQQPLELARTRSLHYSVENLEGMTRLAEMARTVGVDLWKWSAPNGGSIRKAVEFVAPYADTTNKWPRQQITSEPKDLFVPLLLRSRIALGDARYAQLLDKVGADITHGHRARLYYPLPHPSAPCDAECLALSQVIVAGRRAGWADANGTINSEKTVKALAALMAVRNPSNQIRAAAHGAAAWLKDGLYETPVLQQYEAWNARLTRLVPKRSESVVVDPAYRGPQGVVLNGRRTYNTIGRALDAAPANALYTIHIRNGRYNERVVVEKPHIQFIGESRDSTILSYDVAAGYPSPTGGTFGTRGSWVLRVAAPDFKLSNMTVENTFDYMKNYTKAATDSTKLRDSQAVAVMLDNGSDRAIFESCAIRGHQDTLFPNAGRSYFHGCVITGSVDFIFGAGRAVFDSVDVVSRDRGSKSNNGYITAASTPLSQPYGFVFLNSRLLEETPAMAPNTVSLGRPWHPSGDPNAVANVVFINTWMDDHISSTKRWESMNSTNAAGVRTTHTPEQSRFFEYKRLDGKTRAKYSITNILNGWNPRAH